MKRRPLIITLIALGYILTPVTFLIQYSFFSGLGITTPEFMRLLLTPYKLSFLIFPPVVAYGIYKIHIWGWYLAIAHILYIIGNNITALSLGSRTPAWAILLFSIATLIILYTFVRKEIRAPYFHPRVRWWEAKPRHAITFDVEISNDRTTIEGETYNISEGGLFMVSDADVKIDERFGIVLTRYGDKLVRTEGKIVWVNQSSTTNFPKGFGIVFINLKRDGLSVIRRYIKDQKEILKEKSFSI